MTAIKTCSLTKMYGDKTVVDSLDLTVEHGELFSLLGTNGAGKTTTVKILSTLIEQSGGTAEIFGLDTKTDRQKIREMINISPQETAIAPNLTVKENLEFMAGAYKIKNPQKKIADLTEKFGLAPVLGQKGKTLSGGWQRKLSIAIALINDPKILFLDEPTLGLDVIARKELWHVIEALHGNVTVILTTHYMEEAEKLSDRVAIMSAGKLCAVGTPAEIIAQSGKDNFEDAFVTLATGGEL